MRVRHLVLASALIVLPVTVRAQASATPAPAAKADTSRVDISGKWEFSVQSDVGNGTPMLTFAKAKGDTITGRYSSQALGEHDFVGTYKEGKLLFGFSADVGGQAFTMNFSGMVDPKDKDAMSGSIDFAGMATGTFSGARIKP